MKIFSYIVLILVVLLGVTFACLNAELVSINYYIGQDKMPLSLLLVLTFGMGCLLGLLVGMWKLIRLKREIYRLRSRIKLAEKEVSNLRSIPIKNDH